MLGLFLVATLLGLFSKNEHTFDLSSHKVLSTDLLLPAPWL